MIIYIDVSEDGNVLGWSSTDSEGFIEIEVNNGHPVLTSFGKYRYVNDVLVEDLSRAINETRESKDEELNGECKSSILNGFTHTINGIEYHFSYDQEAQMNLHNAERLLNSGIMKEINFTVKRNGIYERIAIDKTTINELIVSSIEHRESNISKYRDVLLPLVNKANTIEEIEAIKW